jgi:hypothetical protein
MSTSNDVRVKLTAEGVQEVVAAFRKVAAESQASGKKASSAFESTSKSLKTLQNTARLVAGSALLNGLKNITKSFLEFGDSIKDTADNLGVTTDFLQELQYAAVQTGAPVDSLSKAIAFLERKIADSAAKGEGVVTFLDGTAIAATNADGSVRSLREVFDDILRVFPTLASETERASVANQAFSRSGREMVALLSRGKGGFDELAAAAHESGSVLEADALDAMSMLNDQLTELEKRLVVGFAKGLFDDQTIKGVQDLVVYLKDPQFVAAAEKLGRFFRDDLIPSLSWMVANYDAILTLFGGIVGGMAFGPYGAVAGAIGAAMVTAYEPNPAPATRAPSQLQPMRASQPTGGLPTTDAANVIADPVKEREAAAERERSARAQEKIAREAEREAQARQQAVQATEQYEAKLLELQGRRHEAELLALDTELQKYEENLRKRGDLTDQEISTRLDAARAIGEQGAQFGELQRQAQEAFGEIEARRAAITEAVARGQITEQAGQAQLVALDKDRLGGLEKIAAQMLAIAEASGNPDQIAAVRALQGQLGQLRVEADKTGQEFAAFQKSLIDSAESGVATFFEDVVSGSKSADKAFQDLTKSIAQSFLKLISQKLSQKLFDSLLSAGGGLFGGFFGGSPVKKAEGGMIRGPGTGTSDSIPALLSDGEFVVRSKVVAQPGVRSYLEALNAGFRMPAVRVRGGRQTFAAGGYASSAGTAGAGGASTRNVVIQATPDTMGMTLGDWFAQYLATEASKL